MTYPYGYGPPPGWGSAPQFDYPRSNVVYVPIETAPKPGEDPATAMVRNLESVERIKKLFKEEKKDDKKDHPKGMNVKDTFLLLCIFSLPIGWLTSWMCLMMMKGIQSNIHEMLAVPH